MNVVLILLSTGISNAVLVKSADSAEPSQKANDKGLTHWVAQLDDKDSIERMVAINSIVDAGTKPAQAIDGLLGLAVYDEKPYVRQNAKRALVAIGEAAFDAIIRKLESICPRDGPGHLQIVYATMLSRFGKPFSSKISNHLKDENPVVVRACINALADIEGGTLNPDALKELKAFDEALA